MVDRVVLIGFMGAGKSTVGAILAARLGRILVDTDRLVEERAGMPIPRLFTEKGEHEFRRVETEVLQTLHARRGIVVATGGGAPIQPANRFFFEGPSATFHLRVGLGAARARALRGGIARPLLQQDDAAVRELYVERLSVYEGLGIPVETEERSPEEIAEEIVRLLAGPTASPTPGGSGG